MGNLGFQELLVVAVIALLVIGPDRLPELARNAARGLARLRGEARSSIEELKRAADLGDLDREISGLRRDIGEVGRSVTRGLSGGSTPSRGAQSTVRPDDQPPPTDPDAT